MIIGLQKKQSNMICEWWWINLSVLKQLSPCDVQDAGAQFHAGPSFLSTRDPSLFRGIICTAIMKEPRKSFKIFDDLDIDTWRLAQSFDSIFLETRQPQLAISLLYFETYDWNLVTLLPRYWFGSLDDPRQANWHLSVKKHEESANFCLYFYFCYFVNMTRKKYETEYFGSLKINTSTTKLGMLTILAIKYGVGAYLIPRTG